jgi:AraC-like DNA-binding protein
MPALNQAQTMPVRWTIPPSSAEAADNGRSRLIAFPVRSEERERQHGVCMERSWREAPDRSHDLEPTRISARRWKEDLTEPREYKRTADPRFAVLAVALRSTQARLTIDGECVHDGPVAAGFASLTAPGRTASVQFRAPCDVLHLFVPVRRLADIVGEASTVMSLESSSRGWLSAVDCVIERLAWLLLKGGGQDDVQSSDLYLDGIAVAIVSRLLDCSRAGETTAARGLVKWRLKRVQDYIEEQLAERLSLADLARSAGLSRMHFAAQFRAATGMRPHEYLVRRRIQKAQEMLLTTSTPLVEVALSVGFQTQAHFTTVFRRFLGETPGRWREAQRLA